MMKDELEALEWAVSTAGFPHDFISQDSTFQRRLEKAKAALAKLRQPSAEVDGAKEQEAFDAWLRTTPASWHPSLQTMFQAWLARARSGKG